MRVIVPAFVLLAGFAAPALAHEPRTGVSPSAVAAHHPLVAWRPVAWRPAAPAIGAGMRVEVDPATGELVTPTTPVPLETALRAMRQAGLTVRQRPDGSRQVVVGDRLRKWSVASVGPDGAMRHECVSSEEAAVERARAAAAGGR